MPRLLWNLFRLILAVGFCGLVVVAGVFLFQGRVELVAVVGSVMGILFFSINVANFWQYRWDESDAEARALVIAPLVMSGGCLATSILAGPVGGFAAIGIVVVFWFAVTRRRPDVASSRVPARVLITDDGVRRMYANMELDAIDWDDVVRVSVATEAPVPASDELFFFLEGIDEQVCVIPNRQARELLGRLQELPGFDNEALVVGATASGGDRELVWEGKPGQARICGDGR